MAVNSQVHFQHGIAAKSGLSTRPRREDIHVLPRDFKTPSSRQTDSSSKLGVGGSKAFADNSNAAQWLPMALRSCPVGQTVAFPHVLEIGGWRFTHADVERRFQTTSGATLVRLQPQGVAFIAKFEDVRREHAVMCALRAINRRWRERGLRVAGEALAVVTYAILPLGDQAGLVEVVPQSWTLRELAAQQGEKSLRVLHALGGAPGRLDRLAASTAAFLAAGYALGIRDGHDENLMLRADGPLFRVDFGHVFGQGPMGLDAPGVFVPNAVRVALDDRWLDVCNGSCQALYALSDGSAPGPVGWDCLRRVPALAPFLGEVAFHVHGLSHEAFSASVMSSDAWSLSRTLKNTVRESLQYAFAETEVDEADDSFWPF